MNINSIIENLIKEGLKASNLEAEAIHLEHPQDLELGDFSTSVAMSLAKETGKNPNELADQIIENIPAHSYIESVERAGPGFINFYLTKKFFVDFIELEKAELNILEGQKFLVEHSSPNLFKPFHIGHMVNNAIGEALSRIYKFSGAEVTNLSFPSDKSLGIAKTVWGLKELRKEESFDIDDFGHAYVLGTEEYGPENMEVKEQIDEINLEIYNEKGENYKIYKEGLKLSKQYFLDFTKKIGSSFDGFYYESETEKIGKEIIAENMEKVFEESDGAVIFKGSEHGLYDNVFITSAGYATYAGKDIGLLSMKFKDHKFDKSITVADVEQKGHFQVVKKAAELINKEWSDKSEYISHGRLSLVGGEKMSSREGIGDDLIAEKVLDSVKENIEHQYSVDGDKEKLDSVALDKIALASVKYFILKSSAGKNLTADINKFSKFEGDTGPYLQYSYVRANSIINKVGEDFSEEVSLIERDISDLERVLYRFEEAIKKSIESYSPHHVANYLYEICNQFNSFYAQEKILDTENPDYLYNLMLVKKFSEILKDGLYILGIETVEKM